MDPAARRSGLGAALYRRFLDDATRAGAVRVRAVTSPVNTQSVAFHTALGFAMSPVRPDYDGPGNDRVCFTRSLPATGQELATLLHRLDPYRHDGAYVFAAVDAALPPTVHPVVTVQGRDNRAGITAGGRHHVGHMRRPALPV